MSQSDEEILAAQRWMWSRGDYAAVARRLRPISVDLVESVGISEGDRVLDVAVGDGNAALEAARRGAVVTGVDLSPDQVKLAAERAAAEGVVLDLHEGNAEALAFEDGAFDTVLSVMGVIFAPDHVAAVAELARTCRPGGTVAMTSWANRGWFRAWRDRAAALVPDPPVGGSDPDAWGDAGEVAARLRAVGLDVEVTEREFHWSFGSTTEACDFFFSSAGPFIAFEQAATAAGHGDEVRGALSAALDEANVATDGSCRLPAPYLLAIATKRN